MAKDMRRHIRVHTGEKPFKYLLFLLITNNLGRFSNIKKAILEPGLLTLTKVKVLTLLLHGRIEFVVGSFDGI